MRKKIKLSDIAKEAAVSVSAVSAVYNNNTNIRISEAKRLLILSLLDKYSYKSPQNSSDKQSSINIKVITKYPVDLQMRAEILAGMEERLNLYNGNMLVNESKVAFENLLKTPEAFLKNIQGVIFISKAHSKVVEILKKHKIPFAVCGSGNIDGNYDMIYPRYTEYAQKALKYISKMGHKNVALISPPLPHCAYEQNIMFFKEYSKLFNIEKTSVQVLKSEADIYKKLKILLQEKNKPSVIIGHIATMRSYIESLGHCVPKDLSMLAFDISGPEEAPVSFIGCNNKLLGSEAIEAIRYRLLYPDAPPRHISLSLELSDKKTVKNCSLL